MKYCKNCGYENLDEQFECRHCGCEFEAFDWDLMRPILGRIGQIGIFPNLALIFVFYTLEMWRMAKGLLIGAMPYLIAYYNVIDFKSDEYKTICENEGKERAVADYVAGMTDKYAISVYSKIYIQRSWSI